MVKVPYNKETLIHPLFYDAVLNTAIRGIVRYRGGLTVYGEENIKDLPGPHIVASNHESGFDVAPLAIAYKDVAKKRINFVGKKELYNMVPYFKPASYIVGSFFSAVGIFPIDREDKRMIWDQIETINHIGRVITAGSVLGIFSEGTRNSGQDHLDLDRKNIKIGTAILASMYSIPIVPAGIHGTAKDHHHEISVAFGTPIDVEKIDVEELKTMRIRDVVKFFQPITDQLYEGMNSAHRLAVSV